MWGVARGMGTVDSTLKSMLDTREFEGWGGASDEAAWQVCWALGAHLFTSFLKGGSAFAVPSTV